MYYFIFRNTMQGCGYGFLPMMGGVVELAARLIVAVIAMDIHSYWLACACDPAAWVGAGLFTGISYLYIIKKIEKIWGRGRQFINHKSKITLRISAPAKTDAASVITWLLHPFSSLRGT